MNESEYQALVEAGWRRPLTADEQARLDVWLATRPEERAAWETESGLNQLLGQLPDAPLSSNFTAQVLQAAKRSEAAEGRRTSVFDKFRAWLRRPVPRLAWALMLVGLLWFSYDRHQTHVRGDIAKGLSALATVAALSDPVVLQDFEAIQRLGQAAPDDDEELYAVLSQ